MLSGTMTAALLWIISASGALPATGSLQAAPALENTYYAQIDGIT